TPAEIAAYEADGSPGADARVLDRLLDSPHFGERFARRWMDLVRYSESHGSEGDPDTPGAWRYRDYLIRAFNADVPYDQLIREHLAGDLLPSPRLNARESLNESILGAPSPNGGTWLPTRRPMGRPREVDGQPDRRFLQSFPG